MRWRGTWQDAPLHRIFHGRHFAAHDQPSKKFSNVCIIVNKLLDFLKMTFTTYPTAIDEAALAMYFATLLMDDATKRYVRAAEERSLRVHGPKRGSKRTEPGDIEPTRISDQPKAYQDILWEMKEMLEKHMAKEHFREINEHWLETIGQEIVDMGNEKIAMPAIKRHKNIQNNA